MYTQEITVNNEVGLHARPATFSTQMPLLNSLAF